MFLAETVGFEPTLGYYPKHAFQACDLNRSSTSPWTGILQQHAHLPARAIGSHKRKAPQSSRGLAESPHRCGLVSLHYCNVCRPLVTGMEVVLW